VDHLAPGELVEGTQLAFGVPLPREIQIEQSFVDLVRAKGPVGVHSLAAYFTARLEGGGLREGSEAATFEHVRPRGRPEPELVVRIAARLGGAFVEIQKVATPASAEPSLDEVTRWRRSGLTPKGKIIDPTHLD
jgi:hypothetical protein